MAVFPLVVVTDHQQDHIQHDEEQQEQEDELEPEGCEEAADAVQDVQGLAALNGLRRQQIHVADLLAGEDQL